MAMALRAPLRRRLLVCGCAAGVWFGLVGGAGAQPGGSATAAATTVAAAGHAGGLDMDVSSATSAGGMRTAQASPRDTVQDGITPLAPPATATSPQPMAPLAPSTPPVGSAPAATNTPPASNASSVTNAPPVTSAPPGTSAPTITSAPPGTATPTVTGAPPGTIVAAQPASLEPVHLDHPTVINTAELKAGDVSVSLFGIEGSQGDAAHSLQAFLATTDGHLTCQPQATSGFVCRLADGTDIAEVALVNGAAQTKADAPAAYQTQEEAAQAARRGVWANLPAPPTTVKHPMVRDTATLVAEGQTYALDGVQGLGAPYAEQVHGYIVANGDSVTCNPQGAPGHYVCVLADGTDLALVALENGAALVTAEAPDAYRAQQTEALDDKRGYWLNPPKDLVFVTVGATQAATGGCTTAVSSPAGSDPGGDGITYVDGAPTVVIEGVTVFLVYAVDIGWGYYDHLHHWHDAPRRYWAHLEQYHPHGHGLPGPHGVALLHPVAQPIAHPILHPLVPHPITHAVVHPTEPGGHPLVHPGVPPTGHPGNEPPGGVHPGGVHPGEVHPVGQAIPESGGPGGRNSGFHPAATGGGFVRPNSPPGGGHPGPGPAPHPAPVVHAPPPGHPGGKNEYQRP